MAKSDVDKLTEEKIEQGGVLARLYFDMQSKNREEIQPALVELINEHLLKEKGVDLLLRRWWTSLWRRRACS